MVCKPGDISLVASWKSVSLSGHSLASRTTERRENGV